MHYQLAIEDRKYAVEIGAMEAGCVAVTVNDAVFQVNIENLAALASNTPAAPQAVPATPPPQAMSPARPAAAAAPAAAPQAAASGTGAVKAPIPGLILDIKVAVGDTVTAGQTVGIMEAMKMENNINSPMNGKVLEIRAAKGATVADGEVIMVIG